MPENEENELRDNEALVLQAFQVFPEKFRPKLLNKENRLVFTSPFSEFPGSISMPYRISAEDYTIFWETAVDGQPEEDTRHYSLWLWETRYHLIKDWKLENIESSQLDITGSNLPDIRIAVWLAVITKNVIELATSLPNWPMPSKYT